MTENARNDGRQPGGRWRIAVWGMAAILWLLPLVAMQMTDEVVWDETDFIVFGAMLLCAAGTYDLAARKTGNRAYRAAVGVAVIAAFLIVWINLAVGMIGSEDNPANLMFGCVLGISLVGAILARFEPGGMARALTAAAIAHGLVAAVGLFTEVRGGFFSGVLAGLWLLSARLFRQAAREQTSAGKAP